MVIEFDSRRHLPAGERPAIAGVAQTAYDIAVETVNGSDKEKGVYDSLVAISGHPHKSLEGKKAEALMLGMERHEKIAQVEESLKKESEGLVGMGKLLRDAADIERPVEGALLSLTIEAFQKQDRSARLTSIREADGVTARCLLQAPRILNLLSDSQREYLETRLMEQADPERWVSYNQRRHAVAQASYACEAAKRWIDHRTGRTSTIRDRVTAGR
jgi:hypothetical protein